jgi:hypothetical protein
MNWKIFRRNDHGLFKLTVPAVAWRDWGKPERN